MRSGRKTSPSPKRGASALAEGVRGRAPARGQARSKAAAAPRGGADARRVANAVGGVGGGQDPACGKGTLIAGPVTASAGHHGRSSPRGDGCDTLITGAVTSKWSKGTGRPAGDECQNIVWDGQQITSKHNRAKVEPGAPAPTLTQGSELTIATLTYARAMGQTNGEAASEALVQADDPRRLTPLECERLQGFPDGWTCLCGVQPYSTAACRCSDGYRYRALGNAVAVPVVEWIARRLGGGR